MEKKFPSPKYTGTSGEESNSEEPSDLEVELHDDPQREARAISRYESQMRMKNSKCPKGYYICPEVTCEYVSDKKERISLHVTKEHEFTEHAAQAKEELQKYIKEKGKRRKKKIKKTKREKRQKKGELM